MPTVKGDLIKKINGALGSFCWEVQLNGILGMFDEHKQSEDFFKSLLNIVYSESNYNLVNLNFTDKINFPGVDLGDDSMGLAIQVTAKADSKKIKHTIECFLKHRLYDKYNRLTFLVIGDRTKTRAEYDTEEKFVFNCSSDIEDIKSLTQKIASLDNDKLKEIFDFLEKNLSNLKSRTTEPIRLSDEDIKNLVLSIKGVIDDELVVKAMSSQNLSREDDFIKKKNEANDISDDYFCNIIEKSIKYHSDIQAFLLNPINTQIKKCYLSVQSELQAKYINNKEKFENISDFFEYVYDRTAEKFSNELGYDKRKINVMLHYMYFNCDVGISPK